MDSITERRSRSRIVLVVVLVIVIEPRHPIEDEDEDEEEKFARRAKILRGSHITSALNARRLPVLKNSAVRPSGASESIYCDVAPGLPRAGSPARSSRSGASRPAPGRFPRGSIHGTIKGRASAGRPPGARHPRGRGVGRFGPGEKCSPGAGTIPVKPRAG